MNSFLIRNRNLVAVLVVTLVVVGAYLAYFNHRPPTNYSLPRIVFNASATQSATPSAIYLVRSDGSELIKVTNSDLTSGSNPSWDSGKNLIYFASAGANYQIFRMTPDGKLPTILTFGPTRKSDPAVSPSGSRVAFVDTVSGGDIEIDVLDLSTNKVTKLVTTGVNASPTWFSDTKLLYSHTDDKGVVSIDSIENGTVSQVVGGVKRLASSFALSPDKTEIAYIDRSDEQIHLIKLADGSKSKLTAQASGRFLSPSWSPDGKELVAVLSTGTVNVNSNLPPQATPAGGGVVYQTELVTVDAGSGKVTPIPYLGSLYGVSSPNWTGR